MAAKKKTKTKVNQPIPITGPHRKERLMLRRVGTALFGPRWQSELGRELRVNNRTTRRWISGKSAIDDEYWEGIQKLVDRKHEGFGAVKQDFDSFMAGRAA